MKQGVSELLCRLNPEYHGELIRTNIDDYVNKIIKSACIIAISRNEQILGFIAYYDNDIKKEIAFLTMLAIDRPYRKLGYGKQLLQMSMFNLRQLGFKAFTLEVLKTNEKAIKFYIINGFKIIETKGDYHFMEVQL